MAHDHLSKSTYRTMQNLSSSATRHLDTCQNLVSTTRQVGDSASSMATLAFSTMAPPQGATFIFGSWVCVANGSGGFDSHLTNSPTLNISSSEDSNKFARSHDRGVMLLPDLAKEIETTTRVPLGLRLISNQNLLELGLLLRNPSSACAIHHLLTNK